MISSSSSFLFHAAKSRTTKEAKAITVSAARHPKMQEPQPDDAEEAVGHGRAELIATTVLTAMAVALIAIWLGCLSAGVWSPISHKVVSGPSLIIIVIMPSLVWSVCAMLRVVAARIADIDDLAMLPNYGSDNDDEPIQPPIQPPVVPIIPNGREPSLEE